MPRPRTKDDLLTAASAQYDKLGAFLDSMSEAELNTSFTFEDRDRCVRDVLVHLHEWHNLLLTWVETNLGGDPVPFLPPPYNWRTYGELNVEFWKRHQNTGLKQAQAMLDETHRKVMALIESFSDDDLFTKRRFSWTGTTTLGSYCISATSSHYEWAIKKLRAHQRSLGR